MVSPAIADLHKCICSNGFMCHNLKVKGTASPDHTGEENLEVR